MKKFVLILSAIAVSLCVLTACGENKAKPEDDKKVQTAANSQSTTENIEYYKSDAETFEIETPYAKLKYPTKWKDKCVVEKTEGDPYVVTVSGIADDKNIKLFDVVFGTAPKDSYLLGTMTSDGREVTVSIVDYSKDYADDYSADDYPELYAMAEDVNEIISGLVYDYNIPLE